MDYQLTNKKVLITGASGGIGKSLCENYLKAQCKIICTASSEEKINKLMKNYGNDNFYYLIDLSNVNSVSESIKKIAEEHKDIDILINNAGLTSDNLFLRMKYEQWQKVIDVNLNSNFLIIKEILPNMVKRRSGNIIGISSVVALTGNPGQSNYTASKSAIISMYKSIALEVAQRNIRINTVAPGFIQTAMTNELNQAQVESIKQKIPMNKLGNPQDVSNLVLFLSSELSSYITGQTFNINGGMLMV